MSTLWARGSQRWPRGPLHPRRSRGAASSQGDVSRHDVVRQGVVGCHPRPLPHAREGNVREKALSPGGGEKAYERRLFPLAGKEGKDKKARGHTRESSNTSAWCAHSATGSSCPIPGTCMESTRRKPTVVGKQKTSLPAPREVNTNETGRSRPISAVCQSAWRIAGLVAPPGY
jgi:hypothetical protein